jgi:hypothetical protein
VDGVSGGVNNNKNGLPYPNPSMEMKDFFHRAMKEPLKDQSMFLHEHEEDGCVQMEKNSRALAQSFCPILGFLENSKQEINDLEEEKTEENEIISECGVRKETKRSSEMANEGRWGYSPHGKERESITWWCIMIVM